jgi:hypothetical protein
VTNWQWECFEHYTHSGVFGVIDPGLLLSPIRPFKITRNCKLGLVLETLVVGEAQASSAPVRPNGTVRLTTETVEFAGNGGIHCTAHGVLPFSTSETHNAELVKETTQKAQVHSLTARLRNDVAPAYIIDWLGNLNTGVYVWRGSSISEKRETVNTLTLGYGAGAIELSARALPLPNMNFSALELVIAGVRLFLCECAPEVSKGIERPGYIFYVGNPTDEIRTKIRQVLSFCLGNYLVYLGSTALCEKSEIVSFSAMSPPSIGRASEIPVLPPGFLGTGNALIAEQQVVARMANAVYAHYDELRFGSFSWAYWHAMCAPVHMAAGHFGAAIEALQKAYLDSQSGKIERNLVSDKEKWNALIEPFLQAIAEAGLDPSVTDILSRRVKSNLNQKSADKISEAFLATIGITLSPVESAAWKRRNQAAHGAEIDLNSVIPTIMETKLLKIILHRIVLKITGASDRYYDDYTIGHAIRNVIEPVPSPLPATGAAP